MIKEAETENRLGQMALCLKDSTNLTKRTGKESLDGQMEMSMLDNLEITTKMDKG